MQCSLTFLQHPILLWKTFQIGLIFFFVLNTAYLVSFLLSSEEGLYSASGFIPLIPQHFTVDYSLVIKERHIILIIYICDLHLLSELLL